MYFVQFSQSFLYFFIVLTSCVIIYSSLSQHYTQIFAFIFFYLCHCIKSPRRTKSFSELKILYNTVVIVDLADLEYEVSAESVVVCARQEQ